ncbi:MAG: RNase A-like domain-containing protein [Bacteroidota bacterium]
MQDRVPPEREPEAEKDKLDPVHHRTKKENGPGSPPSLPNSGPTRMDRSSPMQRKLSRLQNLANQSPKLRRVEQLRRTVSQRPPQPVAQMMMSAAGSLGRSLVSGGGGGSRRAFSIIATSGGGFEVDMSKDEGHAEERHIGLPWEALLKRTQEQGVSATSFPSPEVAATALNSLVANSGNQKKIEDLEVGKRVVLSVIGSSINGYGFLDAKSPVVGINTIKAVIMKNDAGPFILTAYPVATDGRVVEEGYEEEAGPK